MDNGKLEYKRKPKNVEDYYYDWDMLQADLRIIKKDDSELKQDLLMTFFYIGMDVSMKFGVEPFYGRWQYALLRAVVFLSLISFPYVFTQPLQFPYTALVMIQVFLTLAGLIIMISSYLYVQIGSFYVLKMLRRYFKDLEDMGELEKHDKKFDKEQTICFLINFYAIIFYLYTFDFLYYDFKYHDLIEKYFWNLFF